ncbi:MAG: DUF952 domain-containing protein [Bacteroidia bacterium]|nr:DUF952 domain-containing protein [Bacteroidia bacterium]
MRQAEWEQVKHLAEYEGDTLLTEGFIHCSTHRQVAGVIERYFKPGEALVVLHIDTSKLLAPIKYEASTGGELFPHVYGVIPIVAVVRAEVWPG